MRWLAALAMLCSVASASGQEIGADTRPGLAPDIRDDPTRLKFQDGNFVAVPIPMSNPTLDTGLIAGAAYFFPQTEEQRNVQPASVAGLGAMYTSNDSKAVAVFQQTYWRDDAWRFTGALGAADVRLTLVSPEESTSGNRVDWRVKGTFVFARLSRRLGGDWYGGGLLRFVDTDQEIATESGEETLEFNTDSDVRAVGLGVTLEFDSRDMPTNPYAGRHFKAEGIFNDEAIGSNQSYQTYTLGYRAYHRLGDPLVLAWELQGCQKGGTAPLWDACRIPLRGFSAFTYLGKASASGQLEARWRAYKRLGLVAFAGRGWAGSSFSTSGGDESISSYGAGIRFEVLPAKRLNMRLDFARSDDDDAVYLAVGEAF